MKNDKKPLSLAERLARVIFVLFVISTVFLIFRMFIAPTHFSGSEKVKSDYVLMLFQSILGIIALLLPGFLNRSWQIKLPSSMLLLYAIFLFCAIFLGEIRSFYYKIPNWDTILHTFSGGMLGAIGFSLISLLNSDKSMRNHLSPLFVSMFAFMFAVTLGVFWEFYEFMSDLILGTNMQKFMLEDGTPLVGQAAITDTMGDLAVDSLGAFVVSIIGYFSIRKDADWIDRFELKRN